MAPVKVHQHRGLLGLPATAQLRAARRQCASRRRVPGGTAAATPATRRSAGSAPGLQLRSQRSEPPQTPARHPRAGRLLGSKSSRSWGKSSQALLLPDQGRRPCHPTLQQHLHWSQKQTRPAQEHQQVVRRTHGQGPRTDWQLEVPQSQQRCAQCNPRSLVKGTLTQQTEQRWHQ